MKAIKKAFYAEPYKSKNPKKEVKFGYGALEAVAPQLVGLDAKSNNRMVTINLSTFVAKYSADLDSLSCQCFELRPSPDESTNEAWVPTFKEKMSVVDLNSGQVVAKFGTPSGSPKAVLFSNSGNTAFELVHGFEGAEFGTATLHMYDTATRTLKKSLTLPFQPSDALMSPDGSTLYMIGLGPAGRIQILYYDLLSGTADLTVTLPSSVTFQAPYRMHPNGKIYGQATSFRAGDGLGGVAVYDPQTRKIVSRFDVGLPFGLFINKMEFSPDGLQLYVLDTASIATANRPAAPGNVYLMDAITGHNFGSLPIGGRSSLFFVAPSLQ